MGIADPCRCGEARAWLLRPVRERNAVMAVEARGPRDAFVCLGWYEARVCARCGHTRFWAREYDPGRGSEAIPPCTDCAGTSGWIVDEAPDLLDRHAAVPIHVKLAPVRRKLSLMFSVFGWRGALGARVCRSCLATAWFCKPEPAFPEDLRAGPAAPEPCGRCGMRRTRCELHDAAFDDDPGPSTRAISVRPGWLGLSSGRGRFVVDVCLSCFAVEWYGLELDALREDHDRGITQIDGRAEPGGGPYR